LKAKTSSQPQTFVSMSSFAYSLIYYTIFDIYIAPHQTNNIKDYFGYLSLSMYFLRLNQQKMQARVAFQQQNLQARLAFE
jgi:hypothetical protein